MEVEAASFCLNNKFLLAWEIFGQQLRPCVNDLKKKKIGPENAIQWVNHHPAEKINIQWYPSDKDLSYG